MLEQGASIAARARVTAGAVFGTTVPTRGRAEQDHGAAACGARQFL